MDDHLPVQDQPPVGQPPDGPGHLREGIGQVVSVSGDEDRAVFRALAQHPVPVVLDLEDPAVLREGAFATLGHHELDVGGPERALLGSLLRAGLANRCPVVAAFSQFVDRQAGEDRVVGVVLRSPVGVHVGISLLDQEPVIVLPTLGADERPSSLELVPLEVEQELTLLHPLIGVLHGPPDPPVPDDGRSGTVVVGRNHPLEVGIFDRVVFHMDGQALVALVGGWTLGDGPGNQDAMHFEPEIPVE